MAVIEYSRNILGLKKTNSTEMDIDTEFVTDTSHPAETSVLSEKVVHIIILLVDLLQEFCDLFILLL